LERNKTSRILKINKFKITKKSLAFDIEKGGKATNFIKRKDEKIDGETYLTDFFYAIIDR
jgi:hypothetical protein